MGYYLFQGAYAPHALANLLKKPENRMEIVAQSIEKLGGKVVGSWCCFGEYDVVMVYEAPDHIAAAAFGVAVAAGGALRTSKTTPLFRGEDMVQILQTALKTSYRPPQ